MRLDLTLVQEVPNVSNVNLEPTQCPTQVCVPTVWLVTNVTLQLRQCVKKGSTRLVKVPVVLNVQEALTVRVKELIPVKFVKQAASVMKGRWFSVLLVLSLSLGLCLVLAVLLGLTLIFQV